MNNLLDPVALFHDLIENAEHWAFQINDPVWVEVLVMIRDEFLHSGAPDDAYFIRLEGVPYYFLRKTMVPSDVIAYRFGLDRQRVESAGLIALNVLPFEGRDDVEPTVDYIGHG